MKSKILLTGLLLLCVSVTARAQWVVSDPSNLAQGIVNSSNEIFEAAKTTQQMYRNFQETQKIYLQGKEYYDKLRGVTNLVRNARRVQQCILLVGEISDIYVNNYDKMLRDEYLTVYRPWIHVAVTGGHEPAARLADDHQPVANVDDGQGEAGYHRQVLYVALASTQQGLAVYTLQYRHRRTSGPRKQRSETQSRALRYG